MNIIRKEYLKRRNTAIVASILFILTCLVMFSLLSLKQPDPPRIDVQKNVEMEIEVPVEKIKEIVESGGSQGSGKPAGEKTDKVTSNQQKPKPSSQDFIKDDKAEITENKGGGSQLNDQESKESIEDNPEDKPAPKLEGLNGGGGNQDGNNTGNGHENGIGSGNGGPGSGTGEMSGNRYPTYDPKPNINTQEVGTVKIVVIVNPNGDVIKATNSSSSDINDPGVISACKKSALKMKFTKISGSVNERYVKVYRFKKQ